MIDLARAKGLKVIERHIKPEELSDAVDVFITGSAAEITRVGVIGEQYKYPQISPITLDLMETYSQLVRS